MQVYAPDIPAAPIAPATPMLTQAMGMSVQNSIRAVHYVADFAKPLRNFFAQLSELHQLTAKAKVAWRCQKL